MHIKITYIDIFITKYGRSKLIRDVIGKMSFFKFIT